MENDYYNELKKWNSSYRYQKEMEKVADIVRLRKTTNNPKILDYGCGTGTLVEYLRELRYNAIGIDTWDSKKPYLKQLKSSKLPFKDNSFDFVLFMHSLPHMKNPTNAISEAKRILKKEGKIVLMSPNPRFLKCYWLINLFTGYKKDRTLYKHYSVRELRKLFKTGIFDSSAYYYGRLPFCKEDYEVHMRYFKDKFRERIVFIYSKR